jgi:hypothetical protein
LHGLRLEVSLGVPPFAQPSAGILLPVEKDQTDFKPDLSHPPIGAPPAHDREDPTCRHLRFIA